MCVECLYENRVEIKQAAPINKFHETLLKKFKENQLEDTSELIKNKIGFKQLLSETEAIMKKLWEDLASSIKLIYEMIEQENNSYINLIINNDNLAESSFIDLEKLVQIQNGEILDDWNYKKNSYVKKLDKAKQWLEKEVKNFIEKFKQQMNEILQMFQIETKEQLIWKEGTKQIRGFFWNYSFKLHQITLQYLIQITILKDIEICLKLSQYQKQKCLILKLSIRICIAKQYVKNGKALKR
ncbi:unnamed protein product [Paramecium pentaurelia]|uniref:Uncharacterized protein n=1 Tax=Paramecium pentaurelia TaxID=43138 RepID=A0A8S1USP0_9CILI|nr:unnamed protein product [Paramecium pentaurelia]